MIIRLIKALALPFAFRYKPLQIIRAALSFDYCYIKQININKISLFVFIFFWLNT